MYRSKGIGITLCGGLFAFCINHTDAQEFTAKLNGFNEIGSIPSTTAAAGAPTGYSDPGAWVEENLPNGQVNGDLQAVFDLGQANGRPLFR